MTGAAEPVRQSRGVQDPRAGTRRLPAGGCLRGEVQVPGDKSISHRALLFAALARGSTRIRGLSAGGDVAATRRILELLGVPVHADNDDVLVDGVGGHFAEAPDVLDCGNAGTAMRLLLGALAPSQGLFVLTGDSSLRRRPMLRVVEPLRSMGARIDGRRDGACAPLVLRGGALQGRRHRTAQASAQVKGAILLAGLGAVGSTTVEEPAASRDHTERLLPEFGVLVHRDGRRVVVEGPATLVAPEHPFLVPRDPSQVAFFFAGAALAPGSEVVSRGVGLNPGRVAFFSVLRRFGCSVDIVPTPAPGAEPVGDVYVRPGALRAVEIGEDEVPSLIDELPLVALLASRADGVTRVRGASELRAKESDRIRTTAAMIRALGGTCEELDDGFVIEGMAGAPFGAAEVFADGDHRIAMAASVASLSALDEVVVHGADAVLTSFPGFFEQLEALRHG